MELLTAFIREESREHWPPSASRRLTRPDIQVALLVIGRRNTDYDRQPRVLSINLEGADLPGADLTGARLWDTNLTYVNLTGARLDGANLAGAHLDAVNLTGARLDGANLAGAQLDAVNLAGAYLHDADLTGAHLDGAVLTGAVWPPDVAVPEGWQRDTDWGGLKRADTNPGNPATDAASGA
jgi:hypothetical protein